MHVADGVDVHHQRHKRHHRHHHHCQRINQKTDFKPQCAGHRPGVNAGIDRRHVVKHDQFEHIQRQQEGCRHRQDGDPVGTGATDLAPEQAGQKRTRQRQQRDQQQDEL